MRLKQYRYPFDKKDGRHCIDIDPDMIVRHIGIQMPYRPFISYRHHQGKEPCYADITISRDNVGGSEYIVNLPGMLEFENLNMTDGMTIWFDLLEDAHNGAVEGQELERHLLDVLYKTIIEVGYE